MEIRDAILEAAAEIYARFGPRKATVSDIAQAAGVSRQTVYARFADKDAIISATIAFLGARSLALAREEWQQNKALPAQLDAYLRHCVIALFQQGHQAPGGWDSIIATQPEAHAAVRQLVRQRAEALETILTPYAARLAKAGQNPADLALFISTVGDSLKHSAQTEAELIRGLNTLTVSVLALTGSTDRP